MRVCVYREATSQRTMQLVAGMFAKTAIAVPEVPVVPKSFDDAMLRPPDTRVGERQCACGDRCICTLMARVRHGPDTNLAFIGVEFLLPSERATFLAGNGLPPRRKKCLVCTRYFVNYMYIKARVDPTFRITGTPIAMQAFGNPVLPHSVDTSTDAELAALGDTMRELPASASPVLSHDGYRSDAMLFVDEEFVANSRAGREGAFAALAWKPVVRFQSSHYRYVRDDDTGQPRIVQVGVGVDDATGTGLGFSASHFQQPPTALAAPSEA